MPVSTREWMPSENIAELPVRLAAMNFVMAIRVLPTRAARITFLLPDAMGVLSYIRAMSMNSRVSLFRRASLVEFRREISI